MPILILIITALVVIGAFELAAIRFGADSREEFSGSRDMPTRGGPI